jgi:hypothetical protein
VSISQLELFAWLVNAMQSSQTSAQLSPCLRSLSVVLERLLIFTARRSFISYTACLFYDHAITFGMHVTDFILDISHSKHSARSRDRLPMEEAQDPQLVLVFRESVSSVLWQHSGYCPRFHDAINSGMCLRFLQLSIHSLYSQRGWSPSVNNVWNYSQMESQVVRNITYFAKPYWSETKSLCAVSKLISYHFEKYSSNACQFF